jgi:hypothetical protein
VSPGTKRDDLDNDIRGFGRREQMTELLGHDLLTSYDAM